LLVGSLKTNFGHLEAAAGVAGLMKVVLSIKHGEVPPHLHLKEPNPHIVWNEIPLVIPTTLESWPSKRGPRIGSVSSFGFSGTNAHVVLEEAPERPVAVCAREWETDHAYPVPISARSPEALRALAQAYRGFLGGDDSGAEPLLHNISYSACLRRSHHPHRLMVVGHTRQELVESLEAFEQGESRPGLSAGIKQGDCSAKLVFVYPGQGPQWWGMGRQLLEQEPVFRSTLEACDQALSHLADWSVFAELTAQEADSRLDSANIEIIQVTLFAIQVALTALWREWGVEPAAVVGHSMGEVAAAHVAGVLSMEEAMRVIFMRSHLLQGAMAQGAMAEVELALAGAEQAIRGYEQRVAIAASNGPQATVLSGEVAALEEVLEQLQQQEVLCRRLRTTGVAGHSPQIEFFQEQLVKELRGICPRVASVRMVSTVTGQSCKGSELDAEYWGENIRRPVLFAPAIRTLMQQGHTIFLELSPHPVLAGSITQCLREEGQPGRVLPSLRRQGAERLEMLGSLGALYTLGYPIRFKHLFPTGGRFVRLPLYPWQRERYWMETNPSRPKPLMLSETRIQDDKNLMNIIEDILQRWGREGPDAINRQILAPLVFLGSSRQNLFYVNQNSSSIFALMYVGPEEEFESLVMELVANAKENRLQLNLLVRDDAVAVVQKLGLTTTPCKV